MNTAAVARCCAVVWLACTLPLTASASLNQALAKGCLNCHGTPPRGRAPTIAELAAHYARAQGNETDITRLSAHLREHRLFGGIDAHERLTAEEAERFVRWLVDGGR